MKKRIFALLLCLVCALGLGGCQTASGQQKAQADLDHTWPEHYYHLEWLSDDLDERFQQMFYYALDNPTVDGPFPPDSDPNDTIPSGNGNGSLLFDRQYFPEGNFYKGAFFFIEPPYSVVGVGLDRYVLRGIYDMQGSEENEDGESALRSLLMQIELGECSVSDLSLEYRDPYFRLQNQKIPLLVEEKDGILSVTADLDNVTTIMTDLGNDFILRGVITYQGEEYPFSSYI